MTVEEAINKPGVVIDRWVLRLGKEDGEFQPWHLSPDTFEEDFTAFTSCLDLKRRVISVEERMRDEKAKIKAAKKIVKAEAKAKAKAEEKAQKKAERERVKAEAKIEREKLKADAKAERERLKEEKRNAPSNIEQNQQTSEVNTNGMVSVQPLQTNNGMSGNQHENPQVILRENGQNRDSEANKETQAVDSLNLAAKLERAGITGITPVEEPKPIFTSNIVVEAEDKPRPRFTIPTE
jgi:hypothetical protein